MISWTDQVERRARMLHAEIASWQRRAEEYDLDLALACEPFYRLLNEIYADDMPLAQAKDDSDLLLHIEGAAVVGNPRLSLVSGIFNNVKAQVRDLTKIVSRLSDDTKVTVRDIDLGLSGVVRGSLYLGFRVPLPKATIGHESLLQEQDPIYLATSRALDLINTVAHLVEAGESDLDEVAAAVANDVDDPKVRDAALVAVRRMAPTGRLGVDSIGVSGRNENIAPAELTSSTRAALTRMLRAPVVSHEVLELEGWVREMDLDACRFELRRVKGQRIEDIRCVYGPNELANPRGLLDAKVRVRGRVERRPDETPRLIALDALVVLEAPSPRGGYHFPEQADLLPQLGSASRREIGVRENVVDKDYMANLQIENKRRDSE